MQWEIWRFIWNCWDKWRTRNNCRWSCVDLVSYSHNQFALGWEIWRKRSFHIKVKVMPIHDEIWQFCFSVKDNKMKQKVKPLRLRFYDKFISVLMYALQLWNSVVLIPWGKNYVDRGRVCFMDIKFVYIHLYSEIFFVFKCAPNLFKYTASMRLVFT